jgi:hypothetical protein
LQQEAVNAFRMNMSLAGETASIRLRKSSSMEAAGGGGGILPAGTSLHKISEVAAPHTKQGELAE